MAWYQVLILVLAAAAVAVLGLYFGSSWLLFRRAERFFRTPCVVREHRRTRIPGVWCAVLEYSGRNHSRYVASTRGMLRSRLPRVGSKRYCTICRVRSGSRGFVYWVELRTDVDAKK